MAETETGTADMLIGSGSLAAITAAACSNVAGPGPSWADSLPPLAVLNWSNCSAGITPAAAAATTPI